MASSLQPPAMAEEKLLPSSDGGKEEGVLLYYKYATIPDVSALVDFYESNCKSLGLLGRVRVAPDGVNVTIGGKMASLERHIDVMKANSLFAGTDFKLACCDVASNERVAKECGFTSLSIRVVKELVTFRSHPFLKSPNISNAGRHLSAIEFHSALNSAGNITDDNDFLKPKKIVLLDARNLYETRIGMFQTSDVETLNPKIRQYSDLPAWIDKNSDQLQGSHVLMYCTGGIRCEMASAYIRSKGAGFENVYQLFGGIQRYLEQFPDGGFFRGKNFVFDHRISVGSKSADIVGSCILCGSSFDDYSSRCRCTYCRVLVLVCNGCQEKDSAEYVCELCQKHGKKSRMALLLDDAELHTGSSPDFSGSVETELDSAMNSTYVAPSGSLPSNNGSGPRKLRILCLHGFRQNASGFKGRTASLAKKLKSIAEFVFVDAPHELPFIFQLHPSEGGHDSMNCSTPCHPPPLQSCKRRFAWLVAPLSNYSEGPDWKMADNPFDPLQYQQQTEGFEESFAYLEAIVTQMGPFDGIMGFSQGAAMAALVCKHQQRMRNSQDFRFAILYSGFSMLSAEEDSGQIRLPSLHVFGSSRGRDRQIECKASKELARLFDEGYSHVIEHDMGHIIPTQSPYIDQMRAFLQQFL